MTKIQMINIYKTKLEGFTNSKLDSYLDHFMRFFHVVHSTLISTTHSLFFSLFVVIKKERWLNHGGWVMKFS